MSHSQVPAKKVIRRSKEERDAWEVAEGNKKRKRKREETEEDNGEEGNGRISPNMILSKDEEYWGYMRYRGRRGLFSKVNSYYSSGDAELNPIMARFQDFVRAEPEQFGGEADMLVHPTGSLQDPLGVLLHYPTPTTTSELRNGETGDRGSSCPQRIFEKGVTGSGCLWLDTYARRAKVPDRRDRDAGYVVPTDTRPEAQRTIHEDFSNYILESSKTKVLSVPSPIKKIARQREL